MSMLAAFALVISPPATAVLAADPVPAAGEPKMICKRDRQAAELGSNFRGAAKRVCKTRMEWDELERDAKQTFQRVNESATRTPEYKPQGRN